MVCIRPPALVCARRYSSHLSELFSLHGNAGPSPVIIIIKYGDKTNILTLSLKYFHQKYMNMDVCWTVYCIDAGHFDVTLTLKY